MYRQDYDEFNVTLVYGPGGNLATDDWVNNTPTVSTAGRYSWGVALMPYVKNIGVFKCPSGPPPMSRVTGCWMPFRWNSYAINYQNQNRPVGVPDASVQDAGGTIIVSDGCGRPHDCYRFATCGCGAPARSYNPDATVDPPAAGSTSAHGFVWRHMDGCNHLFYDGHVKWLKTWKQRDLTANSD